MEGGGGLSPEEEEHWWMYQCLAEGQWRRLSQWMPSDHVSGVASHCLLLLVSAERKERWCKHQEH